MSETPVSVRKLVTAIPGPKSQALHAHRLGPSDVFQAVIYEDGMAEFKAIPPRQEIENGWLRLQQFLVTGDNDVPKQ